MEKLRAVESTYKDVLLPTEKGYTNMLLLLTSGRAFLQVNQRLNSLDSMEGRMQMNFNQ